MKAVHLTWCAAKPTQMVDLINIGEGQDPPTAQRSEPINDEERAHARDLYTHVFAFGLDAFFETHWFGRRGWSHIVNDTRLLEKIVLLQSRLTIGPGNLEWERSLSLEGHIIWDLILLCRHISTSIKTTHTIDTAQDLEPGSNVHETAKRSEVFESLITNQHLDPSEVIPAVPDVHVEYGDVAPAERARERADRTQAFWHALSRFCSLREPTVPESEKQKEGATVPPSTPEIDACLASMRALLDQHEPRDILYSVAIARHLLRPSTIDTQRPTQTNDESDPATQVHIARSFLYQETRSGTSPLITRIARMVIRSWIPVPPS